MAVKADRDIPVLEPGRPIERELTGGANHILINSRGVSKAQPGASALPNVPEELRSSIRDETEASTSTGGVLRGTVLLDEAFTAEAMKSALRRLDKQRGATTDQGAKAKGLQT